MQGISESGAKWKPASAEIEIDGRRLKLKGRQAELIAHIARHGSVTAADFPPGARVSHYVFKARAAGVPIFTDRKPTQRGDCTYGAYVFGGPVRLISYQPGERR